MRALRKILLIFMAAAAGLTVSELLFRFDPTRTAILRILRREAANPAQENLRRLAKNEQVAGTETEREIDLLRAQFADEERFTTALASAGLSRPEIQERVAEHLSERQWIEKQIAPELAVTEGECRAFYDKNPQQFSQPQRYRASHLFIAAPQGTAVEIVQEKRTFAQALVMRILGGESFPALAGETSEDGATKARAGDLNYFSSSRIPPEFFTEIEKLRRGQMSAPLQSHLGFHIVQLTGSKPSRRLTFEEAKSEIAQTLANEKRAGAVAQLGERLQDSNFLEAAR